MSEPLGRAVLSSRGPVSGRTRGIVLVIDPAPSTPPPDADVARLPRTPSAPTRQHPAPDCPIARVRKNRPPPLPQSHPLPPWPSTPPRARRGGRVGLPRLPPPSAQRRKLSCKQPASLAFYSPNDVALFSGPTKSSSDEEFDLTSLKGLRLTWCKSSCFIWKRSPISPQRRFAISF